VLALRVVLAAFVVELVGERVVVLASVSVGLELRVVDPGAVVVKLRVVVVAVVVSVVVPRVEVGSAVWTVVGVLTLCVVGDSVGDSVGASVDVVRSVVVTSRVEVVRSVVVVLVVPVVLEDKGNAAHMATQTARATRDETQRMVR